jgi:hypothetical protein
MAVWRNCGFAVIYSDFAGRAELGCPTWLCIGPGTISTCGICGEIRILGKSVQVAEDAAA